MESPAPLALGALVALLVSPGCGGGSGSSPSAVPSATRSGQPSAANPCAGALARQLPDVTLSGRSPARSSGLGQDDRDPRDFLALHALPHGGGVTGRSGATAGVRSGEIAVIEDDGSLTVAANPFDLGGAALRFEPNAGGGYDVSRASAAFRASLGERLSLRDDDTRERALAFSFPFYGVSRGSAFVNSDGNVTFGQGDVGTDARSLGRVLSGAPRIATFFADLNPEDGGGVFLSSGPDALTVTWCAVPDFDGSGKVTAQASLLPGGAVEIRIDASTTLKDAVVALSPGAASRFAAVDLSAAGDGATAGGGGAVGERFAAQPSLDLVAAARRVTAEFGDTHDQLLFWTDTRVTDSGTFAFETTIENSIAGIGQEMVHLASQYGSGGRLSSLVVMDNLGKYPDEPTQQVLGENDTLALVAHETGHRWGATLRFKDGEGPVSDTLLGRQRAHWSFFCDSDASVLEGNDIDDVGGGSFRTVAAVERYSPLDLYAMGLLEPSEVPPTLLVESPVITEPASGGFDRESAPRVGVSFNGTARVVTIDEVLAAMGSRQPPSSAAPRVHRQGWVLIVSPGRTVDPAAVAKLETIRQAFEGFFFSATGGRMTVETGLD